VSGVVRVGDCAAGVYNHRAACCGLFFVGGSTIGQHYS